MDLANGAISGVINKLGELSAELFIHEHNLYQSVREKWESLVGHLEHARAALRKVRGVPPDQLQGYEHLRIWARDLGNESYVIEDEIDSFHLHVHGGGHESLFKRLLDTLYGFFGMPSKRRKIAGNMDNISKRLEELSSRYDQYRHLDNIAVARPATSNDPRLPAMYKHMSQLVGTEKSINELTKMLSPLNSPGQEESSSSRNDHETEINIKKVSVVGQGGLGKTTLVKLLYDKIIGPGEFDCSAFVPVGQNPDLKVVFQDMLEQINNDKYRRHSEFYREATVQQLINELRTATFLGDKKYLIVIDDIWETDSWETIESALVQKNGGSIVITTTRILEVAKKTGDLYQLQKLPIDKSRELLHTRLSIPGGRHPDNRLDQILERCLNKCDGVPLAIITMASLLVDKPSEQWNNICSYIDFHDEGNRQVSSTEWILSLSYYDLPDHLKVCLLYLSIYPEDVFIEKDYLILKWVAEGFVQKKEGTGFYEVGEQYFYELINRSIIQASDRDYDNAEGCRIHDMVLALIRRIAREQNFVKFSNNDNDISPSGWVFRLAHQNRTLEPTHHDRHMDHLRSLIAYSCDYGGLSLARFEYLRVLALDHIRGSIDLGFLESLHLLRYLSLRLSGTNELPDGIGALKLLQTLDLCGISYLPSSVGQLTQLICLHARMATVPNGVIEKLTSLEQLMVHAGPDIVGQFVKELGKLRKLRVLYAELDVTEATMQSDLVESLGNLSEIKSLQLNGSFRDIDMARWNTLVFPQTLQFLGLFCIGFPALPSFINPSRLSNLSILELTVSPPLSIFLDDLIDEEILETLGLLPELCHLRLKTGSMVLTIDTANDGCFQKLRYLSLPHSMVEFVPKEVLANESRDFMPNLEVIEFYVHVQELMLFDEGSCENLGLECIPSLRKIKVEFRCEYAFSDDVEKEEDALRKAIQDHPNKGLMSEIEIYGIDEMRIRPANDEDEVMEEAI